jgi:hypothetical protein
MLLLAIKNRAIEVRLEPERVCYHLTYRLNGTLVDLPAPSTRGAIDSIAEIGRVLKASRWFMLLTAVGGWGKAPGMRFRVPRRGVIRLSIEGRSVDVLVSLEKTALGESAVLRLPDDVTLLSEIAAQKLRLYVADLRMRGQIADRSEIGFRTDCSNGLQMAAAEMGGETCLSPADNESDGANHRPWEQAGATRRDCMPHRSKLVQALSGAALGCSLFWLILPLGIVGLTLGITGWRLAACDLNEMRAGRMDPAGWPHTEQAYRWARWAVLLSVLGLACGTAALAFALHKGSP